MKRFQIKAKDGYPLSVHTFDVETPKAVVQIIHGMEEHQERYEDFAHFLNKHGYSVVSSDLRGHGKTAETLGFFKEKNGSISLLSDQIKIRHFISKQYSDTPVYLFAHSMGTIISRVLLQSQSLKYKKAALSGYPNYQRMAYLGLLCTSVLQALHGPKYKSSFVQNASVGSFNKAIPNASTDIDWICNNQETINSYSSDSYCGFGFTVSAFHDVYRLMIQMHQPAAYQNLNSDMPILLLRGLGDPCTGGQKGALDSYRILLKAGFTQLKTIEYPNMRHEILNEAEHQKVYDDILAFFEP
jgi:alpha-beta hydrolase superfamily lysophospholipase